MLFPSLKFKVGNDVKLGGHVATGLIPFIEVVQKVLPV